MAHSTTTPRFDAPLIQWTAQSRLVSTGTQDKGGPHCVGKSFVISLQYPAIPPEDRQHRPDIHHALILPNRDYVESEVVIVPNAMHNNASPGFVDAIYLVVRL